MITLKHFIDTLVYNCNITHTRVYTLFDSTSNPSCCHPPDIDVDSRFYIEGKFDKNILNPDDVYFKVTFFADDSRVGFKMVTVYMDKEKNVVAADISKASPILISTIQSLRMFNGIPFRHIDHSNEVDGWIVYY